jgi:predicted DNA-binding protein (UPF0251 family)
MDPTPWPEEIAEKEELKNLMQQALWELRPDHREVLFLYDFENRSYEEIAELLDCQLGTVKSRLHRARNELRKIILERRELLRGIFVIPIRRGGVAMDCKTCLCELHQRSWKDIQDTPKELKEHLEQCPSCFEEFQWSNHTREAFFELEKTEIPVNLHHTIMSALESERPMRRKIEVKSWFSFLQLKPALSFAAASVLVIAWQLCI